MHLLRLGATPTCRSKSVAGAGRVSSRARATAASGYTRGLLDDPDLRLGFIVYEEAAHVALAPAGVPNDNRDTTESYGRSCLRLTCS